MTDLNNLFNCYSMIEGLLLLHLVNVKMKYIHAFFAFQHIYVDH